MLLERLLRFIINTGASDLYITPDEPPVIRMGGRVTWSKDPPYDHKGVLDALRELAPSEQVWQEFEQQNEASFIFNFGGLGIFRAHLFVDIKGVGACVRPIQPVVSSLEALQLPDPLENLAKLTRGLVLISGPPGSGRTTTVHSMIDSVNNPQDERWASRTGPKKILVLENAAEYQHEHKHAIFCNQPRLSWAPSSHQILLQTRKLDPDIVVLDDLDEPEKIQNALSIAGMDRLVIATVQSASVVNALQTLINRFPETERQSIRLQLSQVLRGVTNQRLLPKLNPKRSERQRVPAVEILLTTTQVQQHILNDELDEIPFTILNGGRLGMSTLNSDLIRLLAAEVIDHESAYYAALEKEALVDQFRRTGVEFVPKHYSEQRAGALRLLRDVKLSRREQMALLEHSFQGASFVDAAGEASTIMTLGGNTGMTMMESIADDDFDELYEDEGGDVDYETDEDYTPEDAVLEFGKVRNAETRARLVLRRPNRSEVLIELFGGKGILFGRNYHDLQRGFRNDWISHALPADNPENMMRTRKVSKIHGGLRIIDKGNWEVCTWVGNGLRIDGKELPKGQWIRYPSTPFQFDIAGEAINLIGRAFNGQALVLRRTDTIGTWYVVIRNRVDFALTSRGFGAFQALKGSQQGFGVVHKKGSFMVVPGATSRVLLNDKPLTTHQALKSGMTIKLEQYELIFQALTPKDPAR